MKQAHSPNLCVPPTSEQWPSRERCRNNSQSVESVGIDPSKRYGSPFIGDREIPPNAALASQSKAPPTAK
jgi:hypothetical protein